MGQIGGSDSRACLALFEDNLACGCGILLPTVGGLCRLEDISFFNGSGEFDSGLRLF